MILVPTKQEISSAIHLLGRVLLGVSFTMAIPLCVAYLFREEEPFWNFLFSLSLTGAFGLLLMVFFRFREEMRFSAAFVVVFLTWALVAFFGAIPLWLSGHFLSFLDAVFEAMSGFATTGLSLAVRIDHASYAVNTWRHLIMFLGGQGIVLIALSFLIRTTATALGLYFGEARDEKILPNILDTARFIWLVSLVFLTLGTFALSVAGIYAGLKPAKAVMHGLFIFMAAFDTGGFSPQSLSILYYHSFLYEVIAMVLMVLGTVNFNLHYFLWFKKRGELFRNIEMRTFFFSFSILYFCLSSFLFLFGKQNIFLNFRTAVFQLLSAHSGCGFTNLYLTDFIGWNDGALVSIICAMALGGSVCSTTGAIKLMRLGVICKGIFLEAKEWLLPKRAKIVEKYHHLVDVPLEDKRIKGAFIYTSLYCASYFIGAMVGVFCGYGFLPSLFEATSATANVGLSVGITTPAMPLLLKLTYIILMWFGRLEFIVVIVAFGFFYSLVRKR